MDLFQITTCICLLAIQGELRLSKLLSLIMYKETMLMGLLIGLSFFVKFSVLGSSLLGLASDSDSLELL